MIKGAESRTCFRGFVSGPSFYQEGRTPSKNQCAWEKRESPREARTQDASNADGGEQLNRWTVRSMHEDPTT